MTSGPARERFASQLGHVFADPARLERALTHPSWASEHGGGDYQRLEFLGDAVLGMVVAEHLHAAFPDLQEGSLSRMRSLAVRGETLARVATALGVQSGLRLGRGSEASGDRTRPTVLAAAYEAIVGAIFVDGGLEPAREFILASFGARLEMDELAGTLSDAKSALQELTQLRGLGLPSYTVSSHEGPPHAREFVVECVVGEHARGVGSGRSKRAAEQAAAAEAIASLEQPL